MRAQHPQQRISLLTMLRRMWWRWHGERSLVLVFSPHDDQRGQVYEVDGQRYRITRYVRATDPRCFEVWGSRIGGDS
jgi:hypothetical protein